MPVPDLCAVEQAAAVRTRPAAIIICFHPDPVKLGRLITTIAPSVERVILFDNGGLDLASLPAIGGKLSVETRGGVNLGVATGLNLSAKAAFDKGDRYAVSFDQDSLPEPNMIEVLMSELRDARCRSMRVAAIGPQTIDVRCGSLRRSPFVRTDGRNSVNWKGEGTEVVSLLITSGCLFDLHAWKEVPFDDRLFIDYVDFNWCWRLSQRGYVLLGTTRATLRHELSAGLRDAGRITLTKYGATRRYYQSRNALYHLLYVPLSLGGKKFALRNIATTVVAAAIADPVRWQSLRQCIRGLAHGLMKRLGPTKP